MRVTATKSGALLPGYIRIAGNVVYDTPRLSPDVLWFDVPEACRGDVSEAGNFWLLALLPLAFRLGEPLRIAAPVDPVLRHNAEELMRLWARWLPPLRPVRIEAELRPAPGLDGGGRTGLFFTGGVDSFFSTMHFDAAARAEPLLGARPIDDLLFVWGFDIPLQHADAFDRKRQALSAVGRALGKEVITVVTNFRETNARMLDWGEFAHGCALGAAALLLERRFKTVLLSSSASYELLHPWGSHPLADVLMSTRHTEFVHYGAGYARFEKLAYIVRSEVALRHLHVCWREGLDRNCGQCDKCYRTLLGLELLGLRGQAASFPADGFSLARVRKLRPSNPVAFDQLEELIEQAHQARRPEIAEAIAACLARTRSLERLEHWLERFQRIPLARQLWRQIRKRTLSLLA